MKIKKLKLTLELDVVDYIDRDRSTGIMNGYWVCRHPKASENAPDIIIFNDGAEEQEVHIEDSPSGFGVVELIPDYSDLEGRKIGFKDGEKVVMFIQRPVGNYYLTIRDGKLWSVFKNGEEEDGDFSKNINLKQVCEFISQGIWGFLD